MKLARELGDLDGERVAVLVRLRSGRCFYADPEQQPRTGRPRRHGRKLACDDPTTWWAPTAEHREEHAQYGAVRVAMIGEPSEGEVAVRALETSLTAL